MKEERELKNKWLYMHTIDNCPAQYEGQQICYANAVRGQAGIRRLCESLKQIKLEQRLSAKWRKEQGWEANMDRYSYVRILRKSLAKFIEEE